MEVHGVAVEVHWAVVEVHGVAVEVRTGLLWNKSRLTDQSTCGSLSYPPDFLVRIADMEECSRLRNTSNNNQKWRKHFCFSKT